MRILFLGDVVGRSGRDALIAALPALRVELALDCVIVNAENASHGFGLAPDMARAIFAAGADCITLGNHSWDRREIIPYMEAEPRLLRPLNYPPGTPGRGAAVIEAGAGRRVLVMNAMGRLFMDPLDDPFRGVQAALAGHRMGPGGSVAAAVLDFHAEASSEKLAMGHSFDGRLSLVVGTHTHTPSA
ncbi:MAG: TIGR00282 family metallophosphoesterase, partial [Roseomonas sp.]|nr:TIGR00282 family metallophosphoesterase [Roseomonas sp.]